jgi:hypothetical protein
LLSLKVHKPPGLRRLPRALGGIRIYAAAVRVEAVPELGPLDTVSAGAGRCMVRCLALATWRMATRRRAGHGYPNVPGDHGLSSPRKTQRRKERGLLCLGSAAFHRGAARPR